MRGIWGLLVMTGCAGGDGDAGSTSAADSATTSAETAPGDDGATDSDAPTTRDTAGPSMKLCLMTCAAPADCAQTGPAFDADNYLCESGLCRYAGCKSDAECEGTFMSKTYGCLLQSGVKTCVKRCSAAADCVVAGSKLYDADNWACESGGCRWSGCNTDDECAALGAFVCRKQAGSDLKNCVKSCMAAADCATASAAFDADNYACNGGLCEYTGCRDDAECRASLMKSNYACR